MEEEIDMRDKRKVLSGLKLHHAVLSVAAVAALNGTAHAATVYWNPGNSHPAASGTGKSNI